MEKTEDARLLDRSAFGNPRGKDIVSIVILAVIVASIGYFTIYKNALGGGKLGTAEAFMLMLVALAIGEVVSIKTKAMIPSIFVTAALFIVGFWTIFPQDILQLGGIAPNMPGLIVMVIVTHLGTMLNKDELIAQWKTVVITMAGMAGVVFAVMTIGQLILGQDIAAAATPPLTGGLVSAIVIQNAVEGREYLAVIAMAMYVLQGFVGFPLISMCLKIEGRNVLKKFRAGEISIEDIKGKKSEDSSENGRIFAPMPKEYQTDFIVLLKTLVLVLVSTYLEVLTKGYVSKYVYALLIGVLAAEVGFIERKPLEISKSFGLFLTMVMMFVFSGLKSVTIDMLQQILFDFGVLIVCATAGIALVSIIAGKLIGYSKAMSFAIGLGSIAGGFPASYVLSNESAKLQAEDDKEYEFLLEHFLPKTLVSGFVSATSGSVIIAGLFAKLFFG